MFRNKKGALELSITGVVVLIIAITVLGFAIYFIRNLFGQTTETIGQQLTQVQEQLRESMEASGQAIALSTGRTMEVKRGTSFEHYLGIKNDLTADNDEESICHAVEVRCLQAFSGESEVCDGSVVGGWDVEEGEISNKWYSSLLPTWDIRNNDFETLPVLMKVPTSVPTDTYRMEIRVYSDDEPREPCGMSEDYDVDNPTNTLRFTLKVE